MLAQECALLGGDAVPGRADEAGVGAAESRALLATSRCARLRTMGRGAGCRAMVARCPCLPAAARPRTCSRSSTPCRSATSTGAAGAPSAWPTHAGDDVLDLGHGRVREVPVAPTRSTSPRSRACARCRATWSRSSADLLHGGPEAAGFMTSGGTESILLAVKAARARGPGARRDGPRDGAADDGARRVREGRGVLRRALGPRSGGRRLPRRRRARWRVRSGPDTVLLVASAPSYPQGVIDPVADIAALAAARDINCHVDACMGGITLPMLERLGHIVPPFDFRVPGVTSMSVDLHKYGYAPKGASVILHRTRALRKHQTFVTDNWLGGLYASSGVLGTKSGGAIAAAWAVMQHLGEAGYLRLTGAARDATEALVAGAPRHARRARARRARGHAGRLHVRRRRSVRRRRRARAARLVSSISSSRRRACTAR